MRRPDLDDPDLPLSILFAEWPQAIGAFLDQKMLCPGCPIAPFHAITDACLEYSLDEDAFRAEIRRRVEAGSTERAHALSIWHRVFYP